MALSLVIPEDNERETRKEAIREVEAGKKTRF
jgi:hypothetical protein